MTAGFKALEELERDALTEVMNIGVSRAAANLRKMIGDQVHLSVPSIEVLNKQRAARLISEREVTELIAVHQDFDGAFWGRALLIFPEPNSLELVRAVTGDELSAEEVAELEHEALTETGNIILNSCLSTLANMLKSPFTMTLPQILRGPGETLFDVGSDGAEALVLFLYIDFAVKRRDIRGYIALLIDIPSLEILRGLLAEFIARVVGEESDAVGG